MKDLTYKIVTNSNASKAETELLEEIAETVGFKDISLEAVGGTTDLGADGTSEVILVLQYIGLAIATGFFGAVGVDVWKKTKDFVINTFQKHKSKFNPEEQWIYNPIIVIEIVTDDTVVLQIQFPNKNKEFENSLEILDDAVNNFNPNEYISMRFQEGEWVYSKEKFKNQEQVRDEIFNQ